jgi:hypothetical protein
MVEFFGNRMDKFSKTKSIGSFESPSDMSDEVPGGRSNITSGDLRE